MYGLPHRAQSCDRCKSLRLGGRERSYQTEIRDMTGRFPGAMAHHRLIPVVRNVEHAANHGSRSGFTNHPAGEQCHRNGQESDENDGSFDALHAASLPHRSHQLPMRDSLSWRRAIEAAISTSGFIGRYWLCELPSEEASPMTKLKIRPLTPDLWPALEDLFGENGACNGCWCMYWRIGNAYRKRSRDTNKAAFRKVVRRGPPPGFLALDGSLAVGWCQLTPRDSLPWLNRTWRLKCVDEVPVWSISCFYVRKGYRKKR